MRFLLLFLPFVLFASGVNISVNKKVLNTGEELVVTISAEGENIKFPNIQEIDGNTIVGTSTSDNISIINGKMKETITKSYILYPQKSLKIPSFSVIIDGKTYKTKPLDIKVTAPKQTKGAYELDINISKKQLYLGENAVLTLKFIKKADAQSIQIQRPYIRNFLIKEIGSKDLKKDNEEIVIYKFLLIPQKSGQYNIGPFLAQVGKLVKTATDDFMGLQIASMKYQNVYSNKLKVNVEPIPSGTVYGDFNISIKSKQKIDANEPNKIKLTISGCGDFYSIEPFTLNIKNATVYQGKPKLNLHITNNKLCGSFTQVFTVIANRNYKIPSFKLKTFDGKIKTIFSPEIDVQIKNAPATIKTDTKNLFTNPMPKEPNRHINLAYFLLIALISLIIGIIVGIVIVKLYAKIKNSEITKIKKADEKELLNILKKYEENDKIKEIMQKIEENIYKNSQNKIDKKEIIKIIKNLRMGK